MSISDNILPQLEFYRELCNFTPEERNLFDLRAKNITLDECCTELGIDDISGVKRLHTKVKKKMDLAKSLVDMEKWIKEHYS